MNRQLDWKATEDKARRMSAAELHGARIDIQKTLPFADALDREDGGNRGGYYRDEASVYAAEQERRRPQEGHMDYRRMRLAAEGHAQERANREGAPMRIFHDARDGIWYVRSESEGYPYGFADAYRGITQVTTINPEVERA